MKTKEKDHYHSSSKHSSSSSSSKSRDKEPMTKRNSSDDGEENSTNAELLSLPKLEIVNRNNLKCFQKILNRSSLEGVGIDDINTLHMDLELLLSKCALRARALLKEENIQGPSADRNKKTKKGKHTKKKKEYKVEEKPSSTEYASEELQSIMQYPLPRPEAMFNSGPSRTHPTQCGKVLPDNALLTDIKNEATSKFWAFVEPYVAEFVPEDLAVIDELTQKYDSESSKLYEIPPLGKLFTHRWSQEDMMDEKHSSSENCKKIRTATTGTDQENVKDILNRAEQICSSNKLELPENLVERIVGALVDPDLFPDDTKNNSLLFRNMREDELETSIPKRRRIDEDLQPSNSRHANNNNVGDSNCKTSCSTRGHSASLDTRIRRGLEDDFKIKVNSSEEQSDEILSEIIKCQDELKMLCEQNKKQLVTLRSKVQKELCRQERKEKLQEIEEEVIEITKKYTSSRKVKREPGTVAQDLNDGLKILANRQFKLSEVDREHIHNILQRRNKMLTTIYGSGSSPLKC